MLDSNNRCEFCKGVVKNGKGRRLTLAQLTALHDNVCPGLHRQKAR